MIVIVHFSKRKLPEQRAELYKEVVETLLTASHHFDVDVAQALEESGGISMSQRRDLLGRLAFYMHQQGEGTRSVEEENLKSELLDYLKPQEGAERASEIVNAFIVTARQRASFLDERSGRYQFVHLSFQEFLIAHYLAETKRDVDQIADFLEDRRLADPWWREPTLLLLGYLSDSSRRTANELARRLARLPVPGTTPNWPKLDGQDRLAGAALAAAGILEQPNSPPALKEELADLLTELLTSGAGPKEWASTGDTLARLGDPRPGVGVRQDGRPNIIWCDIPSGPFLMGTNREDCPEADTDEELHEQSTTAPYSISRYPVTNAQYRAFVEDGGYARQEYWTATGWAWREREDVTSPQTFGTVFNLPNHPIVGVSWHEAVAFCRWLSQLTGETIRLPTEAEWEKAARGPDGRFYPWGKEFDSAKCNVLETGIGSTCTVGLFADAASLYEVEDLIGNTWEWCQSIYTSYPYHADEEREKLDAQGSRVIRGGSYANSSEEARCAYRYYAHPAHRDSNVGFRILRFLL
jgi:formylglycine-generating enzyme required for sulfatase activity